MLEELFGSKNRDRNSLNNPVNDWRIEQIDKMTEKELYAFIVEQISQLKL